MGVEARWTFLQLLLASRDRLVARLPRGVLVSRGRQDLIPREIDGNVLKLPSLKCRLQTLEFQVISADLKFKPSSHFCRSSG